MPSWKTFWGQKCVVKFESERGFRLLEIIAARVIRNRKIEGKVQSFALRVDEAIRKAIDCQQGEAKRSYRGFVTVVISIIIIVLLLVFFGRVGVFILVFVLYVIAFHKVYVAMLWRLCIFSKFCKGRSVLMLVTLLENVWRKLYIRKVLL